MAGVRVTPLRTDQVVILALSGTVGGGDISSDLVAALLETSTDDAPPPEVVLDLREVEALVAQVARAVITFARAVAERGRRCVLLTDPVSASTRTVLHAVDPLSTVPRAATLEQALALARPEKAGAVGPSPGPPREPSAPLGGLTVIDLADMDAAQETLSANYGNMRVQTRGRRGGMRIASVDLGSVRLDRTDIRMTFDADVGAVGRYHFAQLATGRIAQTKSGVERRYAPGDLFFSNEPDEPYVATIEDTTCVIAMIDPAEIHRLVTAEPGKPASVRFTGHRPASPQAARSWASTVELMFENLSVNAEVMAHPLVVANAARLLTATALATFPNTALVDPTIEDRNDAHPLTVRLAIAFIESNADRDIGVADIARAAYVTIRAVQLAFRRHLDLTPMAYLRKVRLDHARADLRNGVAGQDTVTEIAARWGFGRANVFSARYRAAYDELPSQTLRGS